MYYVYILHLSNNQLYTGYTSDLKRRFQEHQRGKSEFTSQHLPVQLIHYEAYSLESDAISSQSLSISKRSALLTPYRFDAIKQ